LVSITNKSITFMLEPSAVAPYFPPSFCPGPIGKSKAKSAMQIVEIMGLQMYEERDRDGMELDKVAKTETQGAALRGRKGGVSGCYG